MSPTDAPTPVSDIPPLPPRPPEMHKGQAGRVAILAGSRGMVGAAVLSAMGALRGGAGLVRVYCPQSIQLTVVGCEPCMMTVPLGEDHEGHVACDPLELARNLGWADVLAVGPGLGQASHLPDLLAHVLRVFNGPAVVDADGLNNLAGLGVAVWQARRGRTTVLTPHPGEMGRLRAGAGLSGDMPIGESARLRIAHEYAALAGVVLVLKGYHTVVCDCERAYVNQTGNAGMATGGMGDVLTGLLAALLGQGMQAFDAARLAVYTHGLAADRCARSIAPIGFLARDVAEELPAALADASRQRIGFR